MILRDSAFKLIALLALVAAPATAADFYGLLPARDLSPFGFLRLDMRPAHGVPIEPGGWTIETEFATQNTWAMSPGVEKYLTGLESSGRRALGETELARIRDLPGENYLIDLEMTEVDMTLHYRFTPRLSGYLIASAVSYDRGFLDSTVERFHEAFSLSSYGRPAAARNAVNLIYDLKSDSYASLGRSPTSGGLLDPTIGLRYSGIQLGDAWQLSFEGAIKLAVDGEREMLSTGRTDYGLQATAQWRGARQAFYANASAVYYSGGEFLVQQERQIIPTLIVGYEYALTARTNLNIQGYASTSMYSHSETDLDELLGNKYLVTAGFRHRRDNLLISFGLTENMQNINNTPDVGFQFGVTWLP
jgi:ABC-type amino acid transport substrate-binding protein